jgi:hypothetical protein
MGLWDNGFNTPNKGFLWENVIFTINEQDLDGVVLE